jgi:hypothetical protein
MKRWLFLVSASGVTFSNHQPPRSETVFDPAGRRWKKYSSELDGCQKSIGVIYFTKKWRAETLIQRGLQFDDFELWLESCIFKCISWLTDRFVFWGRWSGFSERRGSQDLYLMTQMLLLNSLAFFFSVSTSMIYGLTLDQKIQNNIYSSESSRF